MKKIFTCILLFICFSAHSQISIPWDFSFLINFDSSYKGEVLRDYHDSRGIQIFDTFHYNDWVYIDTVSYKRNQWQIGKPAKRVFDSAYSFPDALVTDTLAACLPNDTSVFTLKYPGAFGSYTTTALMLQFKYKLDLDSGDMAKIEFSIDSGKNWVNGDSLPKYGFLIGTDNLLTDTSKGWQQYTVYPGYGILNYTDTILVRFTLITGSDTAARSGWMIDDVMLNYIIYEDVPTVKSASFQLYPNPAAEVARLKLTSPLTADCKLSVVDAIGRQVFQHRLNKGSTDYSLNVRGWAKGLYFIELADGKGNKTTKKLMVE